MIVAPADAATDRVVLVVDDEPASQRAIRRALTEEGRVLIAASAAEGLRVLAHEAVALVVTDQRMPGMSGTAFLREAVRRWPRVVRVVLTAYADSDTLLEAINTGQVYFFLTKPWQPQELRLVVRRGFERYEAEVERVRLLRDLEDSYTRVRREVEQKSRLLAMTAHELGTPVHILINAISLLRETALPAPAHPWARMAADAAEWMARGLAQIRSATLRGAAFRGRRKAVDLGVLVGEGVKEVRQAAAGRMLTITEVVRGGPVVVTGDRRWLRLAVWNLLSNAVRFTPDGGAVSVEVRQQGEAARLVFRDTGIGIAAEHLEEVFEPFSNAGGDVSLHGSGLFAFGTRGLGLGLAIARNIIVAHGGTIDLTSVPREGTSVRVHLPVEFDPGSPVGSAAGGEPSG